MAFRGDRLPTLDFGENAGEKVPVNGQVCNRFRGAGELADGVLKANVLSTRMACPPGPLGELEPLLFGMLKAGAKLSSEGPYLILKQGGHTLKYEVDTSS